MLDKPNRLIALDGVETLRLDITGIGIVCIGTMSLRLSHHVFSLLTAMAPAEIREELEEDEQLHLSDMDSWWHILNALLQAGVSLPIVDTTLVVHQYEPVEQEPCETGPVSVCIDGVEMNAYQQMRSCGVKICKKCAGGKKGHGPYWIAYGRVEGKRVRKYIGRKLPCGL